MTLRFPPNAKQQGRHFHCFAQGRCLRNLPGERRVHIIIVRKVFAVGGRKDRKKPAGKSALFHARQIEMTLTVAVKEVSHRITPRLQPKTEQHIIVAIKNRNWTQNDYALACIAST